MNLRIEASGAVNNEVVLWCVMPCRFAEGLIWPSACLRVIRTLNMARGESKSCTLKDIIIK